VMSYLPGEEAHSLDIDEGTNILSDGATFHDATYNGQPMKLVIEGLGTESLAKKVTFEIKEVTRHSGYAQNMSDPKVEGTGKDYDYSFAEFSNDWEEQGTMETGRTYVSFWAKDYGAWAMMKVEIAAGAGSFVYQFTIPADADGDTIADRWEREIVRRWRAQFGTNYPVSQGAYLLSPNDDKELRSPDGINVLGQGNTDGYHDMPNHRHDKDMLTVLQEYRGYILSGGGYNVDGKGGFNGGHKRLEPHYKELLVELDVMRDVAHMPTDGELAQVMDRVAKGYNDGQKGAGIKLYWLASAVGAHALPHVDEFASDNAVITYVHTKPNRKLKGFVPLVLVSKNRGAANSLGGTRGGSAVYIDMLHADATERQYSFLKGLVTVVAHELTHNLLDAADTSGFDRWEHVPDGNRNRVPGEAADRVFLMFGQLTTFNVGLIVFEDTTRTELSFQIGEMATAMRR